MRRLAAIALSLFCLTACTTDIPPEIAAEPIGNFQLLQAVVVVDNPTKGPLSRTLDDATVKKAVKDAVTTRLSRIEGGTGYYLGIKVAGYVLAKTGIPVVLAPRSMLFLNIDIYDSKQEIVNKETKHMVVFESAGGDTIIGSGFTQNAKQQLAELSKNAGIEIERWLRENPDWFKPAEGAAAPASTETAPSAGKADAASGPGVTPET